MAVDNAIRESRRCNDELGLQNAYAIRVRILVQEGEPWRHALLGSPILTLPPNGAR